MKYLYSSSGLNGEQGLVAVQLGLMNYMEGNNAK